MPTGFGIDPDQGLSKTDELRIVKLAAELGYASAWTNSGADAAAFDRCLRWHDASGLPTGISAVPASGQPASFYVEQARRLSDATGDSFTLVVGSGLWEKPVGRMRGYLAELRRGLPASQPLYLAALGPLMLRLGGELADGVSLNWCTPEQVAHSRREVEASARSTGRPVPKIIEYIRTAVDPDVQQAAGTVVAAAARYLRFPAYRRHFERMGVADQLEADGRSSTPASVELANRIGVAATDAEARSRLSRLSAGLDLPIVRVLVVRHGDVESARRVLEACRPEP